MPNVKLMLPQSTKKRPDCLTIARTYDGRMLDMLELGVTNYVPMSSFPVRLPSPKLTKLTDIGHRHKKRHRATDR